jgi:NAD(P)-dependent dehydrogenase (short-subunit alcohol dehydrogenase family)
MDVGLFKRTFETNVFGAVRMIQTFLPLLQQSASGRIVNVSSTMGSLTDQSDPTSPYYRVVVPGYQASKAALNGITVAVAKTLAGTPIKVTSVCPGWVKTDLGGPENRAAASLPADEAARIVVAAACLADDAPSGQFLSEAGAVPW